MSITSYQRFFFQFSRHKKKPKSKRKRRKKEINLENERKRFSSPTIHKFPPTKNSSFSENWTINRNSKHTLGNGNGILRRTIFPYLPICRHKSFLIICWWFTPEDIVFFISYLKFKLAVSSELKKLIRNGKNV